MSMMGTLAKLAMGYAAARGVDEGDDALERARHLKVSPECGELGQLAGRFVHSGEACGCGRTALYRLHRHRAARKPARRASRVRRASSGC